MKPVNLGVIGCGVIGRQHIKTAVETDSVNLVAVADLAEKRVQAVARDFNINRSYINAEALLEDPCRVGKAPPVAAVSH